MSDACENCQRCVRCSQPPVQVLTPAVAAPLEPDQSAALGSLLPPCAEVLEAVASQPQWQQLGQYVALAVLSAIGASAVSCCPPLGAV